MSVVVWGQQPATVLVIVIRIWRLCSGTCWAACSCRTESTSLLNLFLFRSTSHLLELSAFACSYLKSWDSAAVAKNVISAHGWPFIHIESIWRSGLCTTKCLHCS